MDAITCEARNSLSEDRLLRQKVDFRVCLCFFILLFILHQWTSPRADKIIVKKQRYQLLNTNREFFPSFVASNFHKFVDESS